MGPVYQLDPRHREVLEWYEANAGRVFEDRPFDVGLSIKVTSLQKGIWKPAGIPYAVSVVQTRRGIYDDQDPIYFPEEGTWEYFYHQQGKSADDLRDPTRNGLFANAALFACIRDRVPVGVIIPSAERKGYQVLGLALVEGYTSGFFRLIGPVSIGAPATDTVAGEAPSTSVALMHLTPDAFDPNSQEDSRHTVIAAVHRRQGAPRFRRALLCAYEGRCAMTDYDAEPALEAAHVIPYRGPQTNHVTNGLLLRADMHDLFDLGLVAVDTDRMVLLLANDLLGTQYERYAGARLRIPRDTAARPNLEALNKHRARSAVA